ncbi:hypothetical protein GWK47_012404 [Chionoecetes opilio]|uniref:Uncharacterized protein n=1 Tax=Chionoecetes opilio TaxID=41210 RepID=A0A8J4Y229_CHIOP|nr:hypothetical protein GWK47_012404 [Chionoecetes opilio]
MEDLINFSIEDLEDFLHNGAEGMEIKKEEVVTPKKDDTSPEQYERFKWIGQLEQEVERTKEALELLLRNKGEEKEVRRPVRSLIKPRDIRMLNLSDLQGIEAEGRLKVFFSQVESCSEDLEARMRILMARVDPPLALYIQNASVKYDWLEDPQDFATKLKCKYAILEAKSKHPGEVPRRDKIIKTKLMRGLPSQSREKLEFFMDEQFPLRKFIERVETERAIAIGRDTNRISRGKPEPAAVRITPASQSIPPNKQEQSQELSASQSEVRELRAQMEGMGRKLHDLRVGNDQKLPSLDWRRNSQTFCPYCKMNNHSAADCRRKPSSNACFDCWRVDVGEAAKLSWEESVLQVTD